MIRQTSENTIAKGVSLVSILMLPAILSAGAFDDAIFWCRGALDKNGDGYPAQGDFPDALHAGDSSYYGHNGSSYYKSSEPSRRLQISTENVVDPATCRQLGLHQCLKFTQPLYDNDGATWIDEQAFLLTQALNSAKPIDADGWTIYIRFRPDGGVRLAAGGRRRSHALASWFADERIFLRSAWEQRQVAHGHAGQKPVLLSLHEQMDGCHHIQEG